jgi:hypothetical protein
MSSFGAFVWRVKGSFCSPEERKDVTKTWASTPFECLVMSRDPAGLDVAQQALTMRVSEEAEVWRDYMAEVSSMERLGWAQWSEEAPK